MNEARLDALLRAVAPEIEYPATPPLSSAVATRISHDPIAPRTRLPRRWVRPVLVAAALVILVGFFSLAFSPTARRAVADLLGVVGIRITTEPQSIPVPDGPRRPLGVQSHVPGAFDMVPFEVKVPGVRAIDGMGAFVFVDETIGDGGMLSLLYGPEPKLGSAKLLITQFRASVDEAYFKKVAVTEGNVEYVEIRDTTGYWLSGKPHLFYYVDSNGEYRKESVRLAGNVLLWEEDGVTYRIEGPELTLDKGQEIAESLH